MCDVDNIFFGKKRGFMSKFFLVKSDNISLVRKKYCGKEELVEFDILEHFLEELLSDNLFNSGVKNRVLMYTNLTKGDVKDILNVLKSIEVKDTIILVQRESISGEAYSSLKKLCNYSEVKEADQLYCVSFVRNFFVEKGLKYSEDVPSYLVDVYKRDLLRIENELNKIYDYCKEEQIVKVSRSVCDLVCSFDEEVEIFDLLDKFFRKKVSEFFNKIKSKDIGYSLFLIKMLCNQIEKMYSISIYKEMGISLRDISTYLGLPIYAIKKMMGYLLYFDRNRLLLLLDVLNKMDMELKSFNINKELLVEGYLLKAFNLTSQKV